MECLRVENPEHGVTVDDPATGQQVVLSEKDAEMVRRTASNRVPDPNVDLYADHVPWFR